MKKSYLIQFSLIILFLCLGMDGFGQILAWNLNGSDGKASFLNTTINDVNLETSVLTRGTGATANASVTNSFVSIMTASADKTAAIANNAYFEFTIKPKTGFYVSLSDLDFSLRVSLAGMYYQFRYSIDGTNYSDIGSPSVLNDLNVDGVFQPTIDLAQYSNLKNISSSTTVTFRMYAWGGSTGSIGFGKSPNTSVPALIVGGVVSNTITNASSDPKIGGWEFSINPASSATVNSTSKDINLNTLVLSRGSGLTVATYNYAYVSTTQIRANKAAAKTANDYYQLTIPPFSGNKVSLSTLKYRFRTSNSTLYYRWAYSSDGGNTFTEFGSDALCVQSSGGVDYELDLSNISALQNVPSTIYLRMYIWSSASTATCGFGRILNGSNAGSNINCIYIRGKVDALPILNQIPVTIETTSNFQKKIMNENVVYFTNRVYTAYNVPANLANYEFLSSDGGVSADGVTPTGTIIPSQNGDIYVLARTSTGVPGWELVPGTEFFYLAGSTSAGISVFKKTVTAGERIPIPVVDNFQEAKPFAKTINYNVYRSVASGNWSDNSKWEVSTDNINWSAAPTAPTSTVSSISIPAGQELVIDAPATASIITVNPAAKLTVNAATTFNATTLNLNSDATGTATFIDNGTSSITNANVQQYLTTGRNWYMSIPISTAASSALSSASSVVCWDETIGDWASPVSSTLNPLRGYISVNTGSTGIVTFSGALNNGEKHIDITRTAGKTKEGFNLVGNPYPSYLNWTSATANAANALTTIWYRTKVDGAYAFHTYNADGGIGTPSGVTGAIPPMQAFWVKAKTGGGRLTFDNTMRSHGSGSNPLKAPANKSNEQKLIRLQVSNGTNKDETVVYFNSKASDNYDSFDSPKMTNNNNVVPEIYTLAGNEELVINGLNDSNWERVIPLGFRSGEANNFTIKLGEFQNFDNSARVLLKDNQENTEVDITSDDSYSFSSDATNTTTRFSLILKAKGVTTELSDIRKNPFVVQVRTNKTLYVFAKNSSKGTVSVYNELGQLQEQANLTNSEAKLAKKL